MTERPALNALAAEFAQLGPLHPAQARRCAQAALRRVDAYVAALEFYRDANSEDLVADAGERARVALGPGTGIASKAVASPEPTL